MREIGERELEDLAIGAAVLGTGGGGNPYIGKLLAKRAIREHGPVTLVSVDEVPDEALVVPSAMMGAPTVMVEKLPSADQISVAVQTPDGVKSASGVMAVVPDRGYSRGGHTSTKGDALVVDLGGGKVLLALLAHLDDTKLDLD